MRLKKNSAGGKDVDACTDRLASAVQDSDE